MKKVYSLILALALTAVITGCGEKLDLSQFPITEGGGVIVLDTSYVLQSPVWTGFAGPEDILVGNDQLVYVADTKNNRIVQMDISGSVIGTLNVYRPHKIAQDNNFDLLIISDTVLITSDTISVLYRIKIAEAGGIISNASKISLIKSIYPTPNTSTQRKFRAVTVFRDNSYIVARTGPEDPYGIDPGNALLKITGRNAITSVTPLSGFQTSGSSFYSIENASSLFAIRNSYTDFILGRSTYDTLTLNKVIWFTYNTTNGTYDPKFTSSSLGIVNTKFGRPEGIVQDFNQYTYVIDSYRNYLYKFNASGDLMKESFGGFGTGEGKFNSPKGISYFNKVLYIVDTGNDRVVRYKLSTDLN